jgi:hypothetical protein
MLGKVGLTISNIETMPIVDILSLYNRYYIDSMNRDIFSISCAGGDVKEIPYYAEYLEKMQRKMKPKYAHMDPEEAKTYKNIFTSALSRIKDGK